MEKYVNNLSNELQIAILQYAIPKDARDRYLFLQYYPHKRFFYRKLANPTVAIYRYPKTYRYSYLGYKVHESKIMLFSKCKFHKVYVMSYAVITAIEREFNIYLYQVGFVHRWLLDERKK